MKVKISLCIPTYKRFDTFLKKNVEQYLKSDYIDEIVINDENGEDYDKLVNYFPNENKLKIYKNDHILGAFYNKTKVVSYAKNNWICLCDSDNYIPDIYFETWDKYINEYGLNNKYVYLPSKTYPTDNHKGFNYEEFNNLTINKYNINNYSIYNNYESLLNTGNYIFHKNNYIITDNYIKNNTNCNALDVLMRNFLLLINNSILIIVPNMAYNHIVHDDSFFIKNIDNYVETKSNILFFYNNIQSFYDIPYKMTLDKWQKFNKYEEEIIYNCSDYYYLNDSWVDFPIGVYWSFINNRNLLSTYCNISHDNLLLLCINPFTDQNRRKDSYVNRIKILETLNKQNFTNSKIDNDAYFKILPTYKFVISPEGNGIDCHRHYEALIAGCIPIVEDNPLVREKYKDCPILYTKDYSEITVEYLNNKYNEMINQVYNFSALYLSTYNNELQRNIKNNGNYWCSRFTGKIWYT